MGAGVFYRLALAVLWPFPHLACAVFAMFLHGMCFPYPSFARRLRVVYLDVVQVWTDKARGRRQSVEGQ